MVQILEAPESFGSIVGKGLGQGFNQGRERLYKEEAENKKFSQQLELEKVKHGLSKESEGKSYDTIKNLFGDELADLWKASTVGGRTKLEERIFADIERGGDAQGFLERIKNKEESAPEEKLVDFDKGANTKERIKRGDQRYSLNLPLQQEDRAKFMSYQTQKEELGILQELSPQIGIFDKLNTNPQTGELFLPGLASPEAQRFVKTVNDFTVRAKDSYGSRVTNFDLNQFLKRLPTLANSEEGRRQIIEQMNIINDIDLAYQRTLHDTLEQYGGIRGIDYDKAQSIADKKAKPEIDELKKKFKEIGKESDSSYKNEVSVFKKEIPKGWVAIEHEGEWISIPPEELKKAIAAGATVL